MDEKVAAKLRAGVRVTSLNLINGDFSNINGEEASPSWVELMSYYLQQSFLRMKMAFKSRSRN
jgi:hypothetical protein